MRNERLIEQSMERWKAFDKRGGPNAYLCAEMIPDLCAAITREEKRTKLLEKALWIAVGRLQELVPNEDAGPEFDALMTQLNLKETA